jgi:hypothetical protein
MNPTFAGYDMMVEGSISQDLTGTPGIDTSGDIAGADVGNVPNEAVTQANGPPSIPNPFSGLANLGTNLEFGAGGLAIGIFVAVIIYMAIKF